MHLIHLIIHLVRVGKGQGLTFNLILVWLYTDGQTKFHLIGTGGNKIFFNFLLVFLHLN